MIFSNGSGHMTKMATTPIYGKKSFKNILQNQKADELFYLVYNIGDVGPTKIVQIMIYG